MGRSNRETLIERLARESGWQIVVREGDNYLIRLDDDSPLRYLNVRCRENSQLAKFWVYFPVKIPLNLVTPALTLGLLKRNGNLYFARWAVEVAGSLELWPDLEYVAAKAGLTSVQFSQVCREMLREQETVHETLRMQVAGLHQVTLPQDLLPICHDATSTGLTKVKAGELHWLVQ